MTRTHTAVALAALALTVAGLARLRTLRRALTTERAAARLTAAARHRDRTALQTQLHAARGHTQLLADADQILTQALNAHTDPKEGR